MRTALLILSVLAAPMGAQTPPPAPAPAPAATIVGKWTLTSEASQAVSTLELKLDDKKVTGTVVGANGTFPIAGTYESAKLTFTMDYNGQLTIAFTGKLLDDGSLAGTMDYGQGPVAWKAVRIKDGDPRD